ncbi:MAG: hypothetical protein COA78_28060 [Blastopirellula sp.]|nr:MAG: hypothetical protein COA78_28060 [Blastopirellula sp.]
MNMIRNYYQDLTQTVSKSWEAFWFVRVETKTVSLLRLLVGSIALIYALLFTIQLTDWYAADGILSSSFTISMLSTEDNNYAYYWSLLYYVNTPVELWILHSIGLLVIGAFAVGFQTRYTSIAAFIFVASYAQRAPMLAGLIEPLLCPMVLYLCFAPCGNYFSVDAWLRAKKQKLADRKVEDSLGANITLRLIQVHLCMFYAMMALTKLGGYTWWGGESMWWLIAQNHSPLVDLRFLRDAPLFVFSWTHLVVLFELCFPLLIWVKVFRPLLIVLSILHWISLSLVTGNWEFGLLILALNVAFFSPEFVQSFLAKPEKSETIKGKDATQAA